MWTTRSLLEWTTDAFKRQDIDSARLDAELLLADTLKTDRLQLFLNIDRPASEDERGQFRDRVQKRLEGASVAAIVGFREFYGRRFRVTAETLIPRPETELLVEAAIHAAQENGYKSFVDVGTGSGCIGLTVSQEVSGLSGTLMDIDSAALAIAKINRDQYADTGAVKLVCADALDRASWSGNSCFEMVIANPPYLTAEEYASAAAEVQSEPKQALCWGKNGDGADWYRSFIPLLPGILVKGGWVGFEIGIGQAPEVVRLMKEIGIADPEVMQDYSQRNRVVTGRLKQDVTV